QATLLQLRDDRVEARNLDGEAHGGPRGLGGLTRRGVEFGTLRKIRWTMDSTEGTPLANALVSRADASSPDEPSRVSRDCRHPDARPDRRSRRHGVRLLCLLRGTDQSERADPASFQESGERFYSEHRDHPRLCWAAPDPAPPRVGRLQLGHLRHQRYYIAVGGDPATTFCQTPEDGAFVNCS